MKSALKKQSIEENTITKITSVKVLPINSGIAVYGGESVIQYKDVTAICAGIVFVSGKR